MVNYPRKNMIFQINNKIIMLLKYYTQIIKTPQNPTVLLSWKPQYYFSISNRVHQPNTLVLPYNTQQGALARPCAGLQTFIDNATISHLYPMTIWQPIFHKSVTITQVMQLSCLAKCVQKQTYKSHFIFLVKCVNRRNQILKLFL